MNFQSTLRRISHKNPKVFLFLNDSDASYNFKTFRYLETQTVKPATKAQITQNIAKKFDKVSLQQFPLVQNDDFDLKKFEKINKIVEECENECLDDKPLFYPSISSILNQTMPPESILALKKWEANKIKELGYEGFQEYRKQIFSRGKTLHQNIENYLKYRDESVLQFPNTIQENIWKSIEHVLPEIDTLYGTEVSVHHPILKFQGIIDCAASYHKVPTLFEWKSSEKLRPTISQTYDNPLQAVAYFSCLQFNKTIPSELSNIKEIILVIGYENGSRADVHFLEHSHREKIWQLFLKRLEKFWTLNAKK